MSPEPSDTAKEPRRVLPIGWVIFWILGFFPPLGMLIVVSSKNAHAIEYSFYLIPLCALYCGIWAGLNFGSTTISKIFYALVVGVGLAAMNWFLTLIVLTIFFWIMGVEIGLLVPQ